MRTHLSKSRVDVSVRTPASCSTRSTIVPCCVDYVLVSSVRARIMCTWDPIGLMAVLTLCRPKRAIAQNSLTPMAWHCRARLAC